MVVVDAGMVIIHITIQRGIAVQEKRLVMLGPKENTVKGRQRGGASEGAKNRSY